MDADEQLPISKPLRSSRIPIAQLSPTADNLQGSAIHATVTLLWPYSSSTKSLSLLLAEPDFRLRHSNGQVKVIFHGPVAEDVAKSQIGIGDEVCLDLAGSRLVSNETAVQTPGKCVAWDVHFDDRVFLEVFIEHPSDPMRSLSTDWYCRSGDLPHPYQPSRSNLRLKQMVSKSTRPHLRPPLPGITPTSARKLKMPEN